MALRHRRPPALSADGMLWTPPAEPPRDATARRSRLFPEGRTLAFADLHNHSLLSDGRGDPDEAFEAMRRSGLDVAALTDHAVAGSTRLGAADLCARLPDPAPGGIDPCSAVLGITATGWAHTGALADAADDPDAFVAIRGFEWSHPVLGHVNVWGSAGWTDPMRTFGLGFAGLADDVRRRGRWGRLAAGILERLPSDRGMDPFYDWLATSAAVGGGDDGLSGFNHPGREPAHFDTFVYDPRVAERMVSVEVFNRDRDFLFASYGSRRSSPIVECLNAGWKVGCLGVTDEHGTREDSRQGSSRAGLWLTELSRAAVAEALRARRFYATILPGLRLDVRAGDAPMGATLAHRAGPVTFSVDLDRGPEWVGTHLDVQVLRPGPRLPTVAHVEPVRLPAPDEPVSTFTVDLDAADGDWVLLRIADPLAPNAWPGPAGHPANNFAVAYASPFWLNPHRVAPGQGDPPRMAPLG